MHPQTGHSFLVRAGSLVLLACSITVLLAVQAVVGAPAPSDRITPLPRPTSGEVALADGRVSLDQHLSSETLRLETSGVVHSDAGSSVHPKAVSATSTGIRFDGAVTRSARPPSQQPAAPQVTYLSPMPMPTPGVAISGRVTLADSGAGLPGVAIYRSHAAYAGELIATTDTEGHYSAPFEWIPVDETITVWAYHPPYVFTPEQYYWRHYFGYSERVLDFSASMPEVLSTPTPTSTATASPTICPRATPEPLWVEPVLSPTQLLTQTIVVRIGNGRAVTVTSEAGVFAAYGSFSAFSNPAEVLVELLAEQTNHLSVAAYVGPVTVGDCPYGNYTLRTSFDRNGGPLAILQVAAATPTPTPTAGHTPNAPTPTPTARVYLPLLTRH
jgi:hypothetical protein